MLNLLKIEFIKVRFRTFLMVLVATLLLHTTVVSTLVFIGNDSMYINPLILGYVSYNAYQFAGVYVVVGLLAASVVGGEFSGRTLGIGIVSANNQRVDLILAKFVLIGLLSAAMPAITWVIVAIVSVIQLIVDPNLGSVEANWWESILGSLLMVIRMSLVIGFYSALALALALITRSAIFTLMAAFLLFLVEWIAITVLDRFDAMQWAVLFPREWGSRWLSLTEAGARDALGGDIGEIYTLSVSEITFGFALLAGTILLVAGTATLFKHRDIVEI